MSEIRFATSPNELKSFDTQKLREQYMLENVLKAGEVTAVYSMHDRMMTLGAVPTSGSLELPVYEDLTKAAFFLERRELGIINIGGTGKVTVDGETFELANKECLYVGRGKQKVTFESNNAGVPAEFYMNSCPAHKEYPTVKGELSDANEVNLGSRDNCNERTIYQFIHEDGIKSCQLVMGFTTLGQGSIWNTFPPHTHLRRMEVYFYFDLPENQVVMHFMGQPQETRHLAMRNKQGVISPEWSIHAGAGTANYSFVWAMAGENQSFTDMDGEELKDVR